MRPHHRLWLPFAFAIAVVAAFQTHVGAGYIDNINGAATPPSDIYYTIAGNDIGWYYTPSTSYRLEGIYTDFSSTNSSHVTPLITMQIQSERPVNGGVVLGHGTFQGDSAAGGIGGAMFDPVALAAGTTYFVDFLNINGMGVNLGLWQNDQHGNPQPSGGATINLGTDYVDDSTSTGFPIARGGGDFRTGLGVQFSVAEPILYFVGVPEPSSLALLLTAGGIGVLARLRWRRR